MTFISCSVSNSRLKQCNIVKDNLGHEGINKDKYG